jgi:hypothetical protein
MSCHFLLLCQLILQKKNQNGMNGGIRSGSNKTKKCLPQAMVSSILPEGSSILPAGATTSPKEELQNHMFGQEFSTK